MAGHFKSREYYQPKHCDRLWNHTELHSRNTKLQLLASTLVVVSTRLFPIRKTASSNKKVTCLRSSNDRSKHRSRRKKKGWTKGHHQCSHRSLLWYRNNTGLEWRELVLRVRIALSMSQVSKALWVHELTQVSLTDCCFCRKEISLGQAKRIWGSALN